MGRVSLADRPWVRLWLAALTLGAWPAAACIPDELTAGAGGGPGGLGGASTSSGTGGLGGMGASSGAGGLGGMGTSGGTGGLGGTSAGGSTTALRSCDALTVSCNDDGTPVSCCSEKLVAGGTFPMGRGEGADAYAGSSSETPEHDVTVDSFLLGTFEVTVGRFRRFVEEYDGTPPVVGAGSHPLIAGSGWQSNWNVELPASQDALIVNIKCETSNWTDVPGSNELHPIECVNWYEAFAFCAWDGLRLPTEAEWEYAAAGGSENRLYPWGQQAPDGTLAVYNCQWGGTPGDCSLNDRPPVGSTPAGAGRWGHHDLGGNVWEWVLDYYDAAWYGGVGNVCSNCANLFVAANRSSRGMSYGTTVDSYLRAAARYSWLPADRFVHVGFRCARTP